MSRFKLTEQFRMGTGAVKNHFFGVLFNAIKYPAASSGVFRSPEELVSDLIPHLPKDEQFDSRPKGRGIKPSPRINKMCLNDLFIRPPDH